MSRVRTEDKVRRWENERWHAQMMKREGGCGMDDPLAELEWRKAAPGKCVCCSHQQNRGDRGADDGEAKQRRGEQHRHTHG